MEQPEERRRTSPWVWILIVLVAILLLLLIWWAVGAQSPREAVVAPPKEEVSPPAQMPAEQPVVVERERPVNIYIEREEPRPTVIVVPRDERPLIARERLRQVNLPSLFRYQGRLWEPSNEAVTSDGVSLKDTGASVDGDVVYTTQAAEPPYDELYLETDPGSGIFIKYKPKS